MPSDDEPGGSAAPAEPDRIPLPDLPGLTLSPKPLSRGPLAAIYRGWDHVHRYDVIVKVQRTTGDQVAADRFRREAAVMARLRHPNIVALYQFYDGDPAALVLEYVAGQTLAELVAAGGALSPARAALVVEQIAAALDCAHAQGVIHRDVKPSNILIPKRGQARLSDFGIAHLDDAMPLTVMGDILGTIEYASPEQVHGNEVPDGRSDVYSLAAVAYFALTGLPPFPASDNSTQAQLSVMHRQVFSEPPSLRSHRADLSPEIEQAVLRGLAKSPAARYSSAGQFAATLRAASEAGVGAAELRAMAAASRRTGAMTGALAAAALLILGMIALWQNERDSLRHSNRPVLLAKRTPSASTALPSKSGTPKMTRVVPIPVPVGRRPAPASHSAANPLRTAVRPHLSHSVMPMTMPATRLVAAHPTHHLVKTAARAAPAHAVRVRVADAPRPKRTHRAQARHLIVAEVPPLWYQSLERPRTSRPAVRTGKPIPVPEKAWLYVYANQTLASSGRTGQMTKVPAREVYVDGHSTPMAASGGWVALAPGKHLISFVPPTGGGFRPNKGAWVTLAPGAYVSQVIPLSIIPTVEEHVAKTPAVPRSSVTPAANPQVIPALNVGWYAVTGWIAADAAGPKTNPVRASADWIKVDGHPVPALALGQWTQLPAGKHQVTFQPQPGLGVGPKTWDIDLAAQTHLNQNVPLPSAAGSQTLLASHQVGWYAVSGWVPVSAPGRKPTLARASAQWVKVDGRPVTALAIGQWAQLSAGKHVVTFQPTPALHIAPKTWDIDLAPQAHLDQKIPFSAAP